MASSSMERFFLDCEYLFSIDDRAFFRKTTEDAGALMLPEEDLYASGVFRNFEPEYLAFAGITATQIGPLWRDRYSMRTSAVGDTSFPVRTDCFQ